MGGGRGGEGGGARPGGGPIGDVLTPTRPKPYTPTPAHRRPTGGGVEADREVVDAALHYLAEQIKTSVAGFQTPGKASDAAERPGSPTQSSRPQSAARSAVGAPGLEALRLRSQTPSSHLDDFLVTRSQSQASRRPGSPTVARTPTQKLLRSRPRSRSASRARARSRSSSRRAPPPEPAAPNNLVLNFHVIDGKVGMGVPEV